jgi:hypothetical protein
LQAFSWRGRWSEIAQDARRITHGNLDVRFQSDPGPLKRGRTFRKYPARRLKRRLQPIFRNPKLTQEIGLQPVPLQIAGCPPWRNRLERVAGGLVLLALVWFGLIGLCWHRRALRFALSGVTL